MNNSEVSFYVSMIEEAIEGQIERIQSLGYATVVLSSMLSGKYGSLPELRRALGLPPREQKTYVVDPDVWLP